MREYSAEVKGLCLTYFHLERDLYGSYSALRTLTMPQLFQQTCYGAVQPHHESRESGEAADP